MKTTTASGHMRHRCVTCNPELKICVASHTVRGVTAACSHAQGTYDAILVSEGFLELSEISAVAGTTIGAKSEKLRAAGEGFILLYGPHCARSLISWILFGRRVFKSSKVYCYWDFPVECYCGHGRPLKGVQVQAQAQAQAHPG